MKKVIQYYHPVLRKKAKKVEDHEKVKPLIAQMKETLKKEEGTGLAAPQVGESLRVIIVNMDDNFYSFINPEIIEESEEKIVVSEGCLSLKGLYFDVMRSKAVKAKFLDEEGREREIKADGMMAIALQHEIDHLDGKLILDRMGMIKKMSLLFPFYFRKLCPSMR